MQGCDSTMCKGPPNRREPQAGMRGPGVGTLTNSRPCRSMRREAQIALATSPRAGDRRRQNVACLGRLQISGSSEIWVPHSATQVSPGRVPWLRVADSNLFPTVALLIILLVASTARVDAVEPSACGAGLIDQQTMEWNATHGPMEPPPPFRLLYAQCSVECDAGLRDVDREDFSQTFSAWILPCISLTFQILFGAEGELCTLSGS
jgi:hypothetical protein